MSNGVKSDGGKLNWSLLPLGPIREIIQVLMFGAKKYARGNYKQVRGARRRYYEAAMRHLTDWYEGSTLDAESGMPELAHALTCIIMLRECERLNLLDTLRDEIDEEDATGVKPGPKPVEMSDVRQPPPQTRAIAPAIVPEAPRSQQ